MNKKDEAKMKKALEASIKHWQKDIIDKFDAGDSVVFDDCGILYWQQSNIKVRCYDTSCSLCRSYDCMCSCGCPYELFYGIVCFDYYGKLGHWELFHRTPCKRTAVNMKKALQRILDNWEKFKLKYDKVMA